MKKRNDSTEIEKLTEAAAEHHETCRQRLLACRETAKAAETDAHQALEDERAQRALLATQADEPSAEQVKELKRLAVLAVEARSDAALASSRVLAADTAMQQASKDLRAAQRVEAEVAYHQAQLALAEGILELAPLHDRLNEALAQHVAMGGMDRPAGLDSTFAWARGIQAEADARAPKQAAAPDPARAVIMLRSISVDPYGQFVAGEPCGFPPEISAALVAQGDAKWAVDGEFENRSALVRAARNVINRVARSLGRRVAEDEVREVGWQAA